MTEPLIAQTASATNAERNPISRHRRIHKEIGAVTGVSFMDHPQGRGVLVSALNPQGACATSGVRVGDHVTKINGERPTGSKHAVDLCDAAWTTVADGTDKNKDRLKFSLHLRTQDFEIGRRTSGLSAGALVEVEVLGSSSSSTRKSLAAGLLGGGSPKKVEDSGLTLEDSPAGFGGVITAVEPDSPAHIAGLETGLTIVSVDEVLCPKGHKEVAKMIDGARVKNGCARLVCHLKKTKEDDDHI
mmetsp:Transcript_26519/g.53284  ORF Transcript_26519/g.53284 Transcript_26519/m.53284 type:complete len:244 (-) Transcript_26519:540-1271(-)